MKRLVIAVSLLSMVGATAALAQDREERREDRHEVQREVHRDVQRDVRRDEQRDVRRDVNRDVARDFGRDRFVYHGAPINRYRGPAFFYPRGFGYRVWGRGQYLPRAYFAAPYYLDNWSYYRLGPPPIGYRYIRVGPDVLLVNLRTGLIAETIPGMFY